MKQFVITSVLICMVGCSTTDINSSKIQSDADIIETSILWKAETDSVTWEPIQLAKLLEDTNRFKPVGSFYEILDDTQAFGAKVVYIGLVGINWARGPNAVIQSRPDRVAEFIKNKYKIDLTYESGGEAYWADLGKELRLIVVAHPSIEGASVIIGEYTGL